MITTGFLVAEATRIHAPEPAFSTFAFGRNTGSWRTGDEGAQLRMMDFGALHGVRNIYGIRPAVFNARIGSREEFKKVREERFGNRSVTLWLGTTAEGVSDLDPEEALWVASGDCLTVVLSDGHRVVPFHVGIHSLVGKEADGSWVPPSRRETVVHNALYDIFGVPSTMIRAYAFCGIRGLPYSPEHPIHGEGNQRLIDLIVSEKRWGAGCFIGEPHEGRIALHQMVRNELIFEGVPPEHIRLDGEDTFTSWSSSTDEFRWWSCARGDRERNGVLVVRK